MLYAIELKKPNQNWAMLEAYSSLSCCKEVLKEYVVKCKESGYTILNKSSMDFTAQDAIDGRILKFRISK